jgi:hypothetical protein
VPRPRVELGTRGFSVRKKKIIIPLLRTQGF